MSTALALRSLSVLREDLRQVRALRASVEAHIATQMFADLPLIDARANLEILEVELADWVTLREAEAA